MRSDHHPIPVNFDGFCLRCRYSLKGLTEQRCPECGLAFDPSDPSSYSLTSRNPAWKTPVASGIILPCALISLFLTYAKAEVLLIWYIGRFTYRRIGWGMRFWIGQAQFEFVLASLCAIACAVLMRKVRGTWYALFVRCVAWVAVTWWIGWILAICFGWLAVYPIYREHPFP